MINLKNLITEGNKNVKVLIRGGKEAGDTLVHFSVYTTNDLFVFLPKTHKMLDALIPYDESDTAKSIETYLKLHTKLDFDYNPSYVGAGYGFTLNFDKILKQLK